MPTPKITKAISLASQMYKPTKFRFTIPQLPFQVNSEFAPGVGRGLGNVAEIDTQLQFSTESVFFPSRNIASEPFKTAGPVEEVPYESTYSGDLDVTMRVSGDFRERHYFELWMDMLVNRITQEFSYPDDYQCEAFIHAEDNQGKELYVVRLTDVWPKGVGRVTVGQGLTDTLATMQVQLAFRRYFVELPELRNRNVPEEFYAYRPGEKEFLETHDRAAREYYADQVAPTFIDDDGQEYFDA